MSGISKFTDLPVDNGHIFNSRSPGSLKQLAIRKTVSMVGYHPTFPPFRKCDYLLDIYVDTHNEFIQLFLLSVDAGWL